MAGEKPEIIYRLNLGDSIFEVNAEQLEVLYKELNKLISQIREIKNKMTDTIEKLEDDNIVRLAREIIHQDGADDPIIDPYSFHHNFAEIVSNIMNQTDENSNSINDINENKEE